MANTGFGYLPTHPGKVVKEEIEYRGISQRVLAKSIGMPYSAVNEILNGKRPDSTRTSYIFYTDNERWQDDLSQKRVPLKDDNKALL